MLSLWFFKRTAVAPAALAPANPSSQDRAVAAQARQTLNEARLEARQEQIEGDEGPAATPVSPARAAFQHANQAYRDQGAQDGLRFLDEQTRNVQYAEEQGFSFII